MSDNLEIEGNVVGNGEEDQSVEEGRNEEDGGRPGLRKTPGWDNEMPSVHGLLTWNNRGGRIGDRVVIVS